MVVVGMIALRGALVPVILAPRRPDSRTPARRGRRALPVTTTTPMPRRQPTAAGSTRHRLLEGVLLRLARLPDAGRFVLRGGMLMRMWFRPLARVAGDLDLVATFPFSIEETA